MMTVMLKRWTIFSGFTIFEFINHEKVTFFSAKRSPYSSHIPCQIKNVPKNIFYYQCDRENCTDQVLNFLLYSRHKYIPTESSHLQFWSVYLCHGFMQLFLCSSRFDWQTQFLFSENSFSEELAYYWLLTPYVSPDENRQPSLEIAA